MVATIAAVQHYLLVSQSASKRTLSLRPSSLTENGGVQDPEQVVLAAIANRVRICADYNRGAVVLQPVLLFREHDALFLVAQTVSRDGKPPREAKLGTFRLSGLLNMRRLRAGIDSDLVEPADWQSDRPARELVASVGSRAA